MWKLRFHLDMVPYMYAKVKMTWKSARLLSDFSSTTTRFKDKYLNVDRGT